MCCMWRRAMHYMRSSCAPHCKFYTAWLRWCCKLTLWSLLYVFAAYKLLNATCYMLVPRKTTLVKCTALSARNHCRRQTTNYMKPATNSAFISTTMGCGTYSEHSATYYLPASPQGDIVLWWGQRVNQPHDHAITQTSIKQISKEELPIALSCIAMPRRGVYITTWGECVSSNARRILY